MSTEPYAVLAVDLDPQHFPDGDDICLAAGSYLARELGTFLKQHGHDIPDWIQGGCEEDFGVVLEWQAWHALADRLRGLNTRFEIEPGIRFAGQVGEQATMFLYDPSGNALEFKAFKDPSRLFAR